MSAENPRPFRAYDRIRHYRDLSVTYEGSAEAIQVRVPDLSAAGMFINTPRTYPEGSVLKLHFFLERTSHEVNIRAEVRYILPGVGIGVEFVDISPADSAAIEAELGA